MKNYIQRGDVMRAVAPAGGVVSGAVVVVGSVAGIAATSAAEGEEFELNLTGVYSLPKADGAIDQGGQIYWDAAAGVAGMAEGGTKLGFAFADAAPSATTVDVRLRV